MSVMSEISKNYSLLQVLGLEDTWCLKPHILAKNINRSFYVPHSEFVEDPYKRESTLRAVKFDRVRPTTAT